MSDDEGDSTELPTDSSEGELNIVDGEDEGDEGEEESDSDEGDEGDEEPRRHSLDTLDTFLANSRGLSVSPTRKGSATIKVRDDRPVEAGLAPPNLAIDTKDGAKKIKVRKSRLPKSPSGTKARPGKLPTPKSRLGKPGTSPPRTRIARGASAEKEKKEKEKRKRKPSYLSQTLSSSRGTVAKPVPKKPARRNSRRDEPSRGNKVPKRRASSPTPQADLARKKEKIKKVFRKQSLPSLPTTPGQKPRARSQPPPDRRKLRVNRVKVRDHEKDPPKLKRKGTRIGPPTIPTSPKGRSSGKPTQSMYSSMSGKKGSKKKDGKDKTSLKKGKKVGKEQPQVCDKQDDGEEGNRSWTLADDSSATPRARIGGGELPARKEKGGGAQAALDLVAMAADGGGDKAQISLLSRKVTRLTKRLVEKETDILELREKLVANNKCNTCGLFGYECDLQEPCSECARSHTFCFYPVKDKLKTADDLKKEQTEQGAKGGEVPIVPPKFPELRADLEEELESARVQMATQVGRHRSKLATMQTEITLLKEENNAFRLALASSSALSHKDLEGFITAVARGRTKAELANAQWLPHYTNTPTTHGPSNLHWDPDAHFAPTAYIDDDEPAHTKASSGKAGRRGSL